MTKIILLDSNSLINRAFYAMPPMNAKDGTPTNAVYGFMLMLNRLISEHNPTHIAAVFDLKAPTFRHLRYENYKATRKPMPDDLAAQIPLLHRLLESMNIKVLELEGYEADDIIGTIAKRFDYDTIIVSGDRDVLQLVDGNTVVFNTKRGVTDIKVYNLESLREEGFTPRQIIEYKALAGDASDNIPGCSGVGEKTAKSLIEQYGSVDNIYENIENIQGKLKERLIADKDKVYLSRELASINTDVPLPCEMECMIYNGDYKPEFYDLLSRLNFRSLLPKFAPAERAEPVIPKEEIEIKEVKIEDLETLNKILSKTPGKIAVDIGKTINFSFDGRTEYIVEPGENLIDTGISFYDALSAFKGVFEGGAVKILFDVKSVMHILDGYGIRIEKPYEDILLKSYLADANNTPKSLKDLLASSGVIYAAAGAFNIDDHLDKKLEKLMITGLYRDIELPLIEVLYNMEKEGFRIDTAVLNELSEKYTAELQSLAEEIFSVTGETFNINSPQQLGRVLYEKLNLQKGKKTKTGFSVAAEVLEELDHPVIKLLLRYRQIQKLQSTYINGMRSVIDLHTKKVHTVFKQCQTLTGRLSSTEPNLQNIPIRTEEGREIRRMFIPSPGNLLVSADYSQIELRLLAHFSGDPVLNEAYMSGRDIHTITAAKIYNVPTERVTKSMRRDAKAVNFGIIYGISPFGLANNIGVSSYQAKQFQAKYFETYPKVKEYMASNVEFAQKNGYISTLKGRIRFFPEFRSANHNIRSFGERAAMNMPLQGSASDIIKLAMLNVSEMLKKGGYKAKLILQVHDELLIDTPKDEVEEVKNLLVRAMESAVELNVPLIADAKVGENWYTVE